MFVVCEIPLCEYPYQLILSVKRLAIPFTPFSAYITQCRIPFPGQQSIEAKNKNLANLSFVLGKLLAARRISIRPAENAKLLYTNNNCVHTAEG